MLRRPAVLGPAGGPAALSSAWLSSVGCRAALPQPASTVFRVRRREWQHGSRGAVHVAALFGRGNDPDLLGGTFILTCAIGLLLLLSSRNLQEVPSCAWRSKC